MPRLPRHRFHGGDALFFGLVRQHRTRNRVADGEYPLHVGLEPPVDGDEPAIVALDPDLLQPETVREGSPPDRDQNRVAVDGFAAAAVDRLKRDPERISPPLGSDRFGGCPERHALPFEQARHLRGDLAIHPRQDAVQILDHRHLRAQPLPDGTQLEPDIAAADHDKAVGNGLQGERAGRRKDARLADGEPFEFGVLRAGRDQNAVALQDPGLSRSIDRGDLDPAGAKDARAAGNAVDPVLPEQEGDSPGQVADDLVLPGEHPREVEGQALDRDPVIPEMIPRIDEALRGFE